MGGHGHHGHGEPYEIPDYRIYKVEDVPKLMATKKALESLGLKDPWLRNEVWRYNPKEFSQAEGAKLRLLFFRGFKYGFAAFVATVIGTAAYDKMFPDEHDHGHGGHH